MAGIDIYTGLCLHFDGNDNGTTFTDSAYISTKSIVYLGNTVTKTGEKKFGTASCYLDGSGDYLYAGNHADWYFGILDFTIDCWIKVSSTSADYVICSHYSSDTLKWMFYVSSQTLAFLAYTSTGVKAVDIKGTGTELNDNAWHHVAVVRNGQGANSCKLYVDGNLLTVTTTVDLANRYMPSISTSVEIGRQANSSAYKYFNGYIDELRISKGIARWTGAFTPPTEAYSRSGIYYIDPELGSDINNGESWATAWKTIKSGATAARLVAGDVIKVAKSPDPVSIGNALWTNLSKNVILSSPQSKGVDFCETAWMGVTNVTVTADAADYKQGTKSAKFVVGATFTTGKMGWKQIAPATDYSAYSGLTFWFKSSILPVAGVFKLCLCSDISGETIVDTCNIPSFPTNANPYWGPVAVDTGVPLGSSIRSVALYAITDPGTPTVYIDDIVAYRGPNILPPDGTPASLTLVDLISKTSLATQGTEPWWGIQSISGEVVMLDNDPNCLGNTGAGYYGTTETVESYKRTPFRLVSGEDCYVQDSGVEGSYITFSGGYDKVLDQPSGETFFDGVSAPTYVINYNSKNYIRMTQFSVCRGYTGVFLGAGNSGEFTGNNISNCISTSLDMGSGYSPTAIVNNFVNVGAPYPHISFGNSQYNASLTIGKAYGGATGIAVRGFNHRITFGEIANTGSTGFGVSLTTGFGSVVKGGWIKNCGTGIQQNYESLDDQYAYDITFMGCITNVSGSISSKSLLLYRPVFMDGTVIGAITAAGGTIRMISVNNDPGDNRYYMRDANMVSQTAVRHTESGIAWKLSATGAYVSQRLPLKFALGRLLVLGGVTTTISCYMRRTNVELTCGLFVKKWQLLGMNSDVQSLVTAAPNTWQLVSVQVTPSETGVIEFAVLAYGGTTHSVYIDDIITSVS